MATYGRCATANTIVPVTSPRFLHKTGIYNHLRDTTLCFGKLARKIPTKPPIHRLLTPKSADCGQL